MIHLPVWIKADGCTSALFCLSTAVFWMGGAEKCVPADLLLFWGKISWNWLSDARFSCVSTELLMDIRPRSSVDTQRQFKQLQKTSAEVRRPHIVGPVFAFLWRNCICGKTSNIHSTGFQMCYTQQKKTGPLYGHDCRCFASSSSGAGPSSLQQEGAAALDPHQEKTLDPHTERTQWTNSGANDLLTCTPHVTLLSHYLFGHC